MGTNEPSADAVEQTPVVQQTSQTEQEESQLVGMQTLCYEVSPGGRSAPARLGSEALSEAAPSTPDRKTCGEEEVLDGYLAWTLGAELPKTVSPLLLCSPEYSPSVVRTDHSGMEKAPGDDADQDHELLQLQESLNQLEPLASISCCFRVSFQCRSVQPFGNLLLGFSIRGGCSLYFERCPGNPFLI